MAASIIEVSRVKLIRETDGLLVFAGALHPQLTVGAIPFGGFLLSIILAACEEAVKETPLHDAIHLTAYFLQACQVGPCEVHVKFLKKGKAFHNLEAVLIQNGTTRITAHLIFGRLGPAFLDPATPGSVTTLTPATPLYRRTPICHPSETTTFDFRRGINIRDILKKGADSRFAERNKRKANTPNAGTNPDMNGILEYGGYYQFVNPTDELTQITIPIIADLHRSTPELLKGIFTPPEGMFNWYPTMVLQIEFKHKIPKGPSYSRNMAAIYSQSRFIAEGRHDVSVEVWTAPPGAPGEPADVVEDSWREKMVCVAVATQMSLSMTAEANLRRGRQVVDAPKL
ncbi:hypothetical protein EXIGLDRAFT_828473 [Exidia glandulosa HHB12029]|uniref:Acyl-CoA thioesterase-like N-terminal HotDog domain-containing protein n=1 Tax=Exidia glandulosa HHB12029 TaxID=1314781 RepID=A0A165QHE7_EXIGL|nr:hypothetical protein EXIGLDRAFT_828473 [Exidia glandulosa HHB12029]